MSSLLMTPLLAVSSEWRGGQVVACTATCARVDDIGALRTATDLNSNLVRTVGTLPLF